MRSSLTCLARQAKQIRSIRSATATKATSIDLPITASVLEPDQQPKPKKINVQHNIPPPRVAEVTPVNKYGQPTGYLMPDWKPAKWPEKNEMVGNFCHVIPLVPELHAEKLYEAHMQDRQCTWTYVPYGPFNSKEEHRAWMDHAAANADPHYYTVLANDENLTPVGVVNYMSIRPEAGIIEVAFYLSELAHKGPIVTEALNMMMDYAFQLGYRRFDAKADVLNIRSRGAIERQGFSLDGIFYNHMNYPGVCGTTINRDTAWYSVIDKDWPKVKEAQSRWLHPSNFDENGKQQFSLSTLTKPLRRPVRISYVTDSYTS